MNQGLDQLPSEERNLLFRSIFDIIDDGLIICDLETGHVVEANPAAYRIHGYSRDEFIGQQLIAFTHADNRFVLNENFRKIQSDGLLDILTLQARRDGSTFHAEWRGTPFTYQNRSCLLLIIRDVSKRVKFEQALHQREESHAYEQAKLLEISHTLASTTEFRPGIILEQLREIIEYTQAGLFVIKESHLVTMAMNGTPHLNQSGPFNIHLRGEEILNALFNEHQPIRIADVWSHNPQAKFLRELLDDGAAILIAGMHSWMWVPLVVKNRIIGGLGLAHEKRNYFTQHHADLALSAANQAAITMTNVELYAHAQELAIFEERQRLARNLHDAVNQSLFSAGLIAEVLPRLWERDQEEAQQSIQDLVRLTRGAQAEMRTLLAELRPSTLIDSDLGDLLRLLGNSLSGRVNIPVNINVTGNYVLPSDVQVAFYRICQEALFNVAKHSRASQVDINLHHEGELIELRIRDNGSGFDPKQTYSGHYGLEMMRERAEAVGALWTVASQPGHGTELTLLWPKKPPEEDL